jgi:hypothetical protein
MAQSERTQSGGAFGEKNSQAAPAAYAVSLNYDSDALRFEGQFGTFTIIRGKNGTVVGKTEWFKRFDLPSIVAPSERAVTEAHEFERHRNPGLWALSFGFLTFAADGILLKVTHNDNPVSIVLALGGTAVMVYGAERLARAGEALSRSLWWHNRELER